MVGFCKSPISTACIFLLSLSSSALAEDWKSPDGRISVAVPDPTRFVQAILAPEPLVSWKSIDMKLFMFVFEEPQPKDVKLQQSAVIENFSNEFMMKWRNAAIVDSSSEQRGGHEVFSITGKGEQGEITIYVTKIVMSTGGKVYKALVMGIGIDTRTDPDATAFIASFKPLLLKQSIPKQAGTPPPSDDERWANYQRATGAFAFLVFILVIIVCVIVKLSRGRHTDDYYDERPRRRRRRRDYEDDEEERPKRRRRREEDEDD
jgi:hypothetical protein